jgi:hypothetical protein
LFSPCIVTIDKHYYLSNEVSRFYRKVLGNLFVLSVVVSFLCRQYTYIKSTWSIFETFMSSSQFHVSVLTDYPFSFHKQYNWIC